jgi:hypothetical protein
MQEARTEKCWLHGLRRPEMTGVVLHLRPVWTLGRVLMYQETFPFSPFRCILCMDKVKVI